MGYHSDLQTLAQDKVAIEKERDQMSDIVRTCKENVLEVSIQELLRKSREDIDIYFVK